MSSRSIPRSPVTLVLLLIALANMSYAQDEGLVLTARPGLCILQDPQAPRCVMALDLSWQAPLPDNYCLHDSRDTRALACWEEARMGSHHAQLASRENVDYWLQKRVSQDPLARITVRVVSLAQRQPERRRRRHAWSIM